MSEVLPTHTILASGRHFLRLKVAQRVTDGRTEYCTVLEGDAATKELSLWTDNLQGATDAYNEERARYR